MGKKLITKLILILICFGSFNIAALKAQEFPEPSIPENFPTPPTIKNVDRGSSDSMDYETPPNESSGNGRETISFSSSTKDDPKISEGDYDDEAPKSSTQKYTVRKGDTLGSIAKKFFGSTKSWKKIADANGIHSPSGLKVGRVIRIPAASSKNSSRKKKRKVISSPPPEYGLPVPPPLEDNYASSFDPAPNAANLPTLPPLPTKGGGSDVLLYQDKGLPKVLLPGMGPKEDTSKRCVTFDGLTGLTRTVAAYPLGKGRFCTAFGMIWNGISKREGNRLKNGESGTYYQFPICLTYGGDNFEVGMQLPFESYDVYAPLTYNFRDGTDSGMGDTSLRLKFSSQNDNMASCLGFGAIFPTSDRKIGNTTSDNAWEVFGGISTKRKEGGNFHLNGGYQASSGNTGHDGVFFNVGFEYAANPSFTFMGEVNTLNQVNQGKSVDLTLSLRYFPKPGMAITLAAPIALDNQMFFGYDYRLEGQLQYQY
ncbi:MAG: LysM peptidoglycan-binding domain-containing protein [Candidatus Riflebacteria bacterium]|nr:LysM peptidoglycan-binding domain-containing protein [Candidatus Riflebacteria bacterium]